MQLGAFSVGLAAKHIEALKQICRSLGFKRLRCKWLGLALCSTLLLACAQTPTATTADVCATPLDPKVPNSCVVIAQTLWRGARPDKIAAASLLRLGAKTVVNLELSSDDRAVFQDAVVPQGVGGDIGYFRVRDWEGLVMLAPNEADEHVTHFLAITRTQPTPIYVHCRSGQNRTGVMVAAYRVFNGTSIDDAIAEMKRYGGMWFEQDATYIRSLTPQRRSALEGQIAAWVPRLQREATIRCTSGKCGVSSN